MQNNRYTLLNPQNEKDLKISLANNHSELLPDAPYKLFYPSINQFKNLAIGHYLWFIADTSNWTIADCGGSTEQMLGLQHSDLIHQPPQVLFSRTHPEDLEKMFAFSNYWVKFFMQLPNERKSHTRATIFLRMLNASNDYNWMMIQYADQILDSGGNILYGLTLLTNIQHIKKEGIATMSILDSYDETCQQFLCVDGESISSKSTYITAITKRETEVLRLLAKGNSSKQIAAILNLSQKTVDNHRQNMLQKTGVKSSSELVAYGISMGYI